MFRLKTIRQQVCWAALAKGRWASGRRLRLWNLLNPEEARPAGWVRALVSITLQNAGVGRKVRVALNGIVAAQQRGDHQPQIVAEPFLRGDAHIPERHHIKAWQSMLRF